MSRLRVMRVIAGMNVGGPAVQVSGVKAPALMASAESSAPATTSCP